MSTPANDPKLFAGLVPIDSLSEEPLRKLMAKATLHEVAPGQVLFPEGSNDGDAFYVLSGEIALNSKKTGASRVVQGGTEGAKYALANLKPRQFSGTAKTAARILRVDAQLLDTLLTWDQMAGIEVTEFEGDEQDSVWMQKLLGSRALLRLPSTSIQSLFERFEEVSMKAGQIIIRQGDPGDYYYVIKQGRCRVVQKPGAEQKMVALADLSEGDGFGEEALLSEAPRNATIAALTDGSLMRLAKADFVTLLKEPTLERITDKEAIARVQAGAGLLDVRLEGEFRRANLKGSTNIPLLRLRQQLDGLDRKRRYVVYCDTGKRSMAAAYLLSERGFDVAVLKDGINALIKANPAAA